jgi:preprotein translocase subunit SecG
MSTVLPIIIGVVLALVVGVLIFGVISMARGGEFNSRWGNKLMQARVFFQFLAILLFFLLWLSLKK